MSITKESLTNDILDSYLFTKEREDDLVPLILCRHPQNINLIINFIYQRVDSHDRAKKDSLRVSNTICLFFKVIIIKYSRTRLRRTRLGNNKKYVLTEVRLIRGTN